MKRLISLVAATSLAIGGFSLMGCDSSNTPAQTAEDSGSTAGGNGAFGTSPARPGSYLGDKYNTPSEHGDDATPTTQPVANH